jgi:hypothetical protein
VRPPPHASSSATSSSSSTASNDNTLRTGQSIAARMPLLQGPVWWQTIDQLRVMLESLRVLVRADMCTLFLADDITDELYARIITNDNRVWEIAMPATLGLVGASFTARRRSTCRRPTTIRASIAASTISSAFARTRSPRRRS